MRDREKELGSYIGREERVLEVFVLIYISHLEQDLNGENEGEPVVQLSQELVPVTVHIHRVLAKLHNDKCDNFEKLVPKTPVCSMEYCLYWLCSRDRLMNN